MKRTLMFIAFMLGIGAVIYAAAGNQVNWGTSTGGSWVTPDDTTVAIGAPIQVGASSTPYVRAGGYQLTIFSASSATLAALRPDTTGQIAYCNNCTQTILVISTGTAASPSVNGNQWAGVFTATSSLLQQLK